MTNFKDNSGLEEHKPKMSKEERDSMMKKFLAKGGKIEKLEPGYPINVGSLDNFRELSFGEGVLLVILANNLFC